MTQELQDPIWAYAPASIGNVAVGFDVLGAALRPGDGELLGDVVEVRPVGENRRRWAPSRLLSVTGDYAGDLPADPCKNLVHTCRDLFNRTLRRRKLEPRTCELVLYKNLPVCSGLGSSASSVVAALTALNAFHGNPLTRTELLMLAARAEGTVSGAAHLDNVGPSMLGGLQLITPCPKSGNGAANLRKQRGGDDLLAQAESPCSLPFFPAWRFAVVHPHLSVPTRKARAVLPARVPLDLAVKYWQNLAGFIHGLHTRDESLVKGLFRDILIEGFRRKLVRGFAEVRKAALEAGAIGFSLSGSGPSVFAVAEDESSAGKLVEAMLEAFRRRGVEGDGFVCDLDPEGARILRS